MRKLYPLIVIASGFLSSSSFLLNGGRTEWLLFVPLYRFFGDFVLTPTGFLTAGTFLYLLLWLYLSAAHTTFLKVFGSDVDIGKILRVMAMGFMLPQAFLFLFGIFSNYFVHVVGIVLFGFLIPVSLTPHLLKDATNADFYKRSLSMLLSLFVLLVFWTTFYEPLGVI